jgi:HAD superfamily hydrolase (TIGR01549 family)
MARAISGGAVLFDVDGTLVDSNYLHVVAWMEAFRAIGHPVDGAAIHRAIGMGARQLLDTLLGEPLADQVGDHAKTEHAARYRGHFEDLRAFDGSRRLVRTVADRAAVVLATSASPDEVEALRATLEVDDVVHAITGSEDVDAAKPEPDLVQVALQRAGVDAGAAVFVGDTVWDIEASAKAGVPCVAVLTGGISAAELRDAGAVAVYRSVANLLNHLDDSPLRAVLA